MRRYLCSRPERETELFTKWNIPFDQFLDFAVRHELGHAFCQEADEVKAERYSQRLRKSGPISCEAKKQHNLAYRRPSRSYAKVPINAVGSGGRLIRS